MARITRAKARLDLIAAVTTRNNDIVAHRLPYELVSCILGQALASLDSYTSRVRFLRSITAVSSWWRTFALTMPELWTEIVYSKNFNSVDVKDFGVIYGRTKTFMERSKNLPISVSIVTQGTTLKDTHKLLKLIILHLSRCHTLSLDFHVAELAEQYLPLRGPLPLLTKMNLDLWNSSGWSTGGDHRVVIFDETVAYRLYELQLDGNMAFGFSNLPTIGLKRVQIIGASYWEDIARFLTQCTNLEELALGYLVESDSGEVHEPITLSRLRCLTVTGPAALMLGRFLRMTSLSRLTLSGDLEDGDLLDPFPLSLPIPPIHTLHLREHIFPLDFSSLSHAYFLRFFRIITILELESCKNAFLVFYLLTNGTPTTLESLRIYLDWEQLDRTMFNLKRALDTRPPLRVALRCRNLARDTGKWEQLYGQLAESYGERVTYWEMQPDAPF